MENQPSTAHQITLTEWVNLYTDQLYSWALHKVSNKSIAEDLVQETFLKAFQSIDSFENRSNPKTWLLTILNHNIIDYYRTQTRSIFHSPNHDDLMVIENSNDLFDNTGGWKTSVAQDIWDSNQNLLDNSDFIAVLELCKGKLPNNWQLSIQAKYVLNKEAKEICQELNITPSNYWQMLHRAKLLLKKCLESNWFNI